jgi:hypothetical protein
MGLVREFYQNGQGPPLLEVAARHGDLRGHARSRRHRLWPGPRADPELPRHQAQVRHPRPLLPARRVAAGCRVADVDVDIRPGRDPQQRPRRLRSEKPPLDQRRAPRPSVLPHDGDLVAHGEKHAHLPCGAQLHPRAAGRVGIDRRSVELEDLLADQAAPPHPHPLLRDRDDPHRELQDLHAGLRHDPRRPAQRLPLLRLLPLQERIRWW